MSNFEDKMFAAHSENYHASVRKMRKENAEKEKIKAEWEAYKGSKPPLDTIMNGPIRSEEEISRLATEIAIEKNRQQADMERAGMVEPPNEKPHPRSLEAFFGEDKEAMKKAREEQERQQQQNRQRELERERQSKGRGMEP